MSESLVMPRANRVGIRGWVIPDAFSSIDKVKEYLSGDSLQCLLCGGMVKSLAGHLKKHGVTAIGYKDAFKIPRTYPLVVKALSEKFSESALASMERMPQLAKARREMHQKSHRVYGRERSPGYRMLEMSWQNLKIRRCVICDASFVPAHPANRCCSKRCAGIKGAQTRHAAMQR